MRRLIDIREVINNALAEVLLSELKELVVKVDHGVARHTISEVIRELENERHYIKKERRVSH